MRVPRGATLIAALALAAPASAEPAAPSRPAAAASGELYQTVATHTPRAQLSKFLVARAEKAAKARDWAHAIPLYQALVAARGPASPEQKELATLWTLAGQNADAAEAWAAYAAATSDASARHDAHAEAERLAATPDPFADKLALVPMTSEARHAFALGRRAFARKRYGDALVYLQMGYALAPELPGFLRELGATYDKLGATGQKRAFYLRYLVERPFGKNADVVRAELAKDKGPDGTSLGTLVVTSSLPCTEIWLNRERISGKLPAKGIRVAPGRYKGLCFNPKYEMALFQYATVEAGKPATLAFRWAIVVNKLEHPFGRIALENPESPGTMIDLGITSPEVGVAVPGDGRKLEMRLEDDAGVRTEKRTVSIEPGQRFVVHW